MRNRIIIPLLITLLPAAVHAQLARGSGKFLGCILKHNDVIEPGFINYFDQVTPENSGKWTSVESQRDMMDWSNLDTMVAFARENGFPFKQHTFVWGIQQPGWIGSLTQEEQRDEVEEWITAFCQRYPDVDFIDPANEPIHQPPPYKASLGGDGITGWDWLIWVHKAVRKYAPESRLILNEFDVLKNAATLESIMESATLLKDSGLVDAIGCQGHWLEGTSAATVKSHLDQLATLGLDIYITELDLNFASDQTQLQKYQELFPVLWEHPAVKGITLWGYQEGEIWRENGYLLRRDGTERPAMKWLRTEYFKSASVPFARITSPEDGTFFRLESGPVPVTVEPEEPGIPVRKVGLMDDGNLLETDDDPPFEFTVPDIRIDKVYHLTALATGDSAGYLTPVVSFGFVETGTLLPYLETFDQENGTIRDTGSSPWNTLVETAGVFSVQDSRFRANNLDSHGFWSFLVDISGTDGVDLELDVLAEGGLDQDEDYLKVLYRLDGSDPVHLFTGNALFNGGNTLHLSAPGLTGSELQLVIEAFNTGNSEIYSWDNVSVASTGPGTGSPPRQYNGEFRIFPNPVVEENLTILADPGPGAPLEISITDITGRVLLETELRGGSAKLSIQGFTPGIYLVRLAGEENPDLVQKIIVQ